MMATNIRVSISIILLIIFLVNNSTNQQLKTNKCNRATVDKCMANIVIIGDEKLKFPDSITKMNEHCRRLKQNEQCVKDYAKNCLSAEARNTVSVLMYGISRTNKNFCSNNKRKNQYIAIGKCANGDLEMAIKSMKHMVKAFHAIREYKDVSLRIPLVCCNYFKFRAEIIGIIDKFCPNAIDYAETLLDGYTNDALNLLCTDYSDDSDKCSHIIHKTPDWKNRTLDYNSFVMPLAQIIGNL